MSTWKKSTRSSQSGQCVEWSIDHEPNLICVRDSKDPDGPILRFTATEWTAFLAGVHQGEADL
ncbi:DUF397 domain-containing protein [Actinoplanes sp. NPDC049596]|uniref:DUF397 domain-containing protein n=1 Tax=unclassified Actinoplanes TaxID=2626549 RepID=UPI00342D7E05